jgi:CHASE2 domain-containing sensor protein
MKFFMLIAPAIAIGMIFVMYKKEDNLKRVFVSFVILWYVVTLGLLGMVMLSLKFLFILHVTALFIAYASMVYYILKGKLLWLPMMAPLVTMCYYLVLVWLGNEHLPSTVF